MHRRSPLGRASRRSFKGLTRSMFLGATLVGLLSACGDDGTTTTDVDDAAVPDVDTDVVEPADLVLVDLVDDTAAPDVETDAVEPADLVDLVELVDDTAAPDAETDAVEPADLVDLIDAEVAVECSAPCDAPPAPTCSGAQALTVHDDLGACVDGACVYEPETRVCGFGCVNGACLPDPCAGVTCDTPPNGCYEAQGACAAGECVYTVDDGASCDDGDNCTTADACTGGTCIGAALDCVTPPADVCADADTLSVYASEGTCAAGTCTYPTSPRSCDNGCDAGACAGDPCAGVSCTTPPAPVCLDLATLQTYAPAGVCEARQGGEAGPANGTCVYVAQEVTCQHGCIDDVCVPPSGLLISEVRYDSPSSPDTEAFIELHGNPGTMLDGVSVVGVNGNGGGDYAAIDLTGPIPADGIFLITRADAPAAMLALADLTTSRADLQNGPDSVQLRYGALVFDALAYGDFGGGDAMAGEGTPHPGHVIDTSLARDADFSDTNDNATDFHTGVPTPGAPTGPCGTGFVPCNDGCVEQGAVCPVTLPEAACSINADCGGAGACFDNLCMCRRGFKPCDGGCCPLVSTTREFTGLYGDVLDFVYAPNGTAYIAIEPTATRNTVTVYALAPTATAWVVTPLTATLSESDVHLEVRADGAVMMVVNETSGRQARLHAWSPVSNAVTRRQFLAGANESAHVGLVIDDQQTTWVLATTESSFDEPLAALSATDVWTAWDTTYGSALTYAKTLHLDRDPVTGAKYAFYATSGNGQTSVERVANLESGEILTHGSCDGQATAFGADGVLWSIASAGTGATTTVCRDQDVALPGNYARKTLSRLPGYATQQNGISYRAADVVIDAEGTVFMLFAETQTLSGLVSTGPIAQITRDGVRWTPASFGGVGNTAVAGHTTQAGSVAAARRPDGHVSIILMPRHRDYGELSVIELN